MNPTGSRRVGAALVVVGATVFAASEDAIRVVPLEPPDATTLCLDVARNEAGRLVVVGGNGENEAGAIFTSDDGGIGWTRRDHSARHRLYGVAFASHERAVAVGLGGTILVGDEAGAKWRRVASPRGGWLAGVAFATPQRGFAVGHGDGETALLLESADGGETWREPAALPGAAGVTLRALAFRDETHGIIVGTGGTRWWTEDGGDTWNAGAPTGDAYLRAAAWRGEELWIVGDAGVVARSRDGGATIESVAFEAGDRLNAIDFLDSRRGLIATMRGVLWSTVDGGATWTRAATDREDAPLTAITVIPDGSAAFVVGDGRLLRAAPPGR